MKRLRCNSAANKARRFPDLLIESFNIARLNDRYGTFCSNLVHFWPKRKSSPIPGALSPSMKSPDREQLEGDSHANAMAIGGNQSAVSRALPGLGRPIDNDPIQAVHILMLESPSLKTSMQASQNICGGFVS